MTKIFSLIQTSKCAQFLHPPSPPFLSLPWLWATEVAIFQLFQDTQYSLLTIDIDILSKAFAGPSSFLLLVILELDGFLQMLLSWRSSAGGGGGVHLTLQVAFGLHDSSKKMSKCSVLEHSKWLYRYWKLVWPINDVFSWQLKLEVQTLRCPQCTLP